MNIQLVERQILLAIDQFSQQGLKREQIERHVCAVLPAAMGARVASLVALYADAKVPASCSDVLLRVAKLVNVAKQEGAEPETIIRNWLGLGVQESTSNDKKSLFSAAMYSVWLLLILSATLALFRIKVYPVLRDQFEAVGSQLPRLTQTMLSPSWLESTVIILIIIGAAMFSVVTLVLVSSIENRGMPPAWLKWVPYFGVHARRYIACEWLHLRMLLQGAMQTQSADKLASELSGHQQDDKNNEPILSAIVALAAMTADARALDNVYASAHFELSRTVRTSTACTMLITAILIGLSVIAMYLPIFQMGEAI